LVEDGEVFKCLDAFPPGRDGDQFTIQHGRQAVPLAGLDMPLEAA
jgi:hypothetical protein